MFRELTSDEVRDIYNRYMKQDFPPQELKPLKNIERMRERGEYSCYGSFEDGRLKAYAFVAEPRGGGMVLLDYLAAVSDERSAGHGSRMLGFLREDWTFDGVHLNVQGCQAWLEYLRTHPVGEVPEEQMAEEQTP